MIKYLNFCTKCPASNDIQVWTLWETNQKIFYIRNVTNCKIQCHHVTFIKLHKPPPPKKSKRVHIFSLGRRLPTAIHKDDENTIINGSVEHVSESDNHTGNTSESDTSEKRRVREWEKHKAPWLEEMKLNQAKRTSTSPGPENKLKLTPTADGNSEIEESNVDKSIEKQVSTNLNVL